MGTLLFDLFLDILCHKWTAPILRSLLNGPRRTMELKRAIEGISLKMLSERLRQLREAGIIARTRSAGFPLQVRYALTPDGKAIQAVFQAWEEMGLSLEAIASIIKCTWTLGILRLLLDGPMRPSQLKRGLPGISNKVLFERLRHLEGYSLVYRKVRDGRPVVVEYTLARSQEQLRAFFQALDRIQAA